MATRDEGQASRLIQTDLGNIHVLDKLKMYMYTLNLESASYGKDLQHAWIVKSTFLKKNHAATVNLCLESKHSLWMTAPCS